MADSIQAMINNLQNQLNSVSSMMTTQPTTPSIPKPPATLGTLDMQPDLFSIVKTAVQSELSRLGLGTNISNNAIPANPVAIPQNPQQTQQLLSNLNQNPINFILPIIGQAFTKEQQEWISQPQILMGMPGFLMSSDGKEILNIMLDSYKDFLNKGSNQESK